MRLTELLERVEYECVSGSPGCGGKRYYQRFQKGQRRIFVFSASKEQSAMGINMRRMW